MLKQERARLAERIDSPAARAAARDRAALEDDAAIRRYETASELGLFRALNFLERRRLGEDLPAEFEGVPIPFPEDSPVEPPGKTEDAPAVSPTFSPRCAGPGLDRNGPASGWHARSLRRA